MAPGGIPEEPLQRRQSGQRGANMPYLLVLAAVAGGLVWIWLSRTHVKGGVITVAAALLAAAGARLLLPQPRVGLLASRRRAIDVAVFGILGAGLLVGALVIPSPS